METGCLPASQVLSKPNLTVARHAQVTRTLLIKPGGNATRAVRAKVRKDLRWTSLSVPCVGKGPCLAGDFLVVVILID